MTDKTAFFDAVEKGDLACVKERLAADSGAANWRWEGRSPPGTKDEDALHLAARSGHLDIVKALLEAGAAIDSLSWEDCRSTPFLAAVDGHFPEIVKYLLEKGADANGRDGDGISCLMYAACSGRVDITKLLLEAGADPNASGNGKGQLPLCAAVMGGDRETIELLIEHGAAADLKEPEGRDARETVATTVHGSPELLAFIDACAEKYRLKQAQRERAQAEALERDIRICSTGTNHALKVAAPLRLRRGV
jgi:uncharacterized protein